MDLWVYNLPLQIIYLINANDSLEVKVKRIWDSTQGTQNGTLVYKSSLTFELLPTDEFFPKQMKKSFLIFMS